MVVHVSRSLDRRPDPTDLTIAICTIGRDEYLQAAIESLLATTPSGVTMHVVFNGCDDRALIDDTTRLLEQWDGPNLITELSERTDIASSHNTALDATETDFVQFMGDDDLALEPRVERLLDLFWTTDPTPAVVSSYCRRVSGTAAEPAFSSNKDYGPDSVGSWLEHRAAG